MKKLIFTLLFIFTWCVGNSQTKDRELSNAEAFSAKVGTLMQMEFVDIGILKGCKIQVVYFTDLISKTKQSALKFEYTSSYSPGTKAAILDTDEVDGFMKSIKIMQENINSTTPINYTEINYRSRGGFEGGCYFSKMKWDIYLKLNKLDPNSYVPTLSAEDLPTLYTFLEQAKAKLL